MTLYDYDYKAILSSSVLHIFHEGIIAYVLFGYEVQVYLKMFDFERKSTFNICTLFNTAHAVTTDFL